MSQLNGLLRAIDNMKTAIEAGNATSATAEFSKIIGSAAAGIVAGNVLRTYNALNRVGTALQN